MVTQPPANPTQPRVHLAAGLAALLLFTALALGASVWSTHLVAHRFDALRAVMAESKKDGLGDANKATYLDHLNSLGTTLQHEAFARTDQLPIYGSSELIRPVPDKAGLFFRDYPTGFAVYPVGRPGTDSFLFLQRIASLGPVSRGKCIALSLSPTWFYLGHPTEEAYASNFSRAQALGALLNPQFSAGLRREIARHLLAHPAPLERDRLLRFFATRLARGSWTDRVACAALRPLAHLEQGIHTIQDRCEVALYIARHIPAARAPAASHKPAAPDWEHLIAEATERSAANSYSGAESTPIAGKSREEVFRECLERGAEWDEFELLLRGLRELHMKTLVLCMPPQQTYYTRTGVSPKALALFSEKIRAVSARWGAEAETFDDHTDDLRFEIGHGDHLSNRGWMYYNRALDQFYHAHHGHGPHAPSVHHT